MDSNHEPRDQESLRVRILRRLALLAKRVFGPSPAPLVSYKWPAWPDAETLMASGVTVARNVEDIRFLAALVCEPEAANSRRAVVFVAKWLAAIRPSQLPRIDEAFRRWTFVHHPRAGAWSSLSVGRLERLCEDLERSQPLLMLATFHASGFIRHRAVQEL